MHLVHVKLHSVLETSVTLGNSIQLCTHSFSKLFFKTKFQCNKLTYTLHSFINWTVMFIVRKKLKQHRQEQVYRLCEKC